MEQLLHRTREIKKKIIRGNDRKYYRFRKSNFYGGIATADCVGCNLSCAFCWNTKARKHPVRTGKYYSPKQVARRLINIATTNGYSLARISGNEPTLTRKHLLRVISLLEKKHIGFILETNGIILGMDTHFVKSLAKYKNLKVRISLKGYNPESFSKITDAPPCGFNLQLKAIQNLSQNQISFNPAIMADLLDEKSMETLALYLKKIDKQLINKLEMETLKLYPHVTEELRKRGLLKNTRGFQLQK